MPNGWFRLSRKVSRTSAVPSPSASRSSVIRLGLTPTEPAAARPSCISAGLSDLGSVRASATSTSPLGNTWSQRGLSRPAPNASTSKPSGAAGPRPSGQPITREKLTAEADWSGSGSFGAGPIPGISEIGAWAMALAAGRATTTATAAAERRTAAWARRFMRQLLLSGRAAALGAGG